METRGARKVPSVVPDGENLGEAEKRHWRTLVRIGILVLIDIVDTSLLQSH